VAIRNQDVPGVVGRIGTLLGEHGINIANFALGRPAASQQARAQRVPLGQAIAVVQVDVPETQALAPALAALKQVEAIATVRMVQLEKA
jgi:D-3-phosphoglycerate dehydrogenase